MDSRFLDLNDTRIHVVTHGDPGGQPVVLLHGGICDHAGISFPAIQKLLPPQIFSVAVDMPGYGLSSQPPAEKNSRLSFSKVVIDVCRILQLQKVVLAGLSLGGQVAIGAALEYEDVVSGLILIAPGGLICDQIAPWFPSVFSRIPFSDRCMQYLVKDRGIVDGALNRMFGDHRALNDDTRALLYAALDQEHAFKNFVKFIRNEYRSPRQGPEFADRLQQIKCQTTLVCGDRDYFFSAVDFRVAAEAIPDSTFLLVPGAGHWLTLEVPDLIAGAITRMVSV